MLLLDVRPLFDRCPGGVTRLTERLLPSVLDALGSHPSEQISARHIPSKLISILTMSGLLRFEQLARKKVENPELAEGQTHLLLFNLGFIGKPKIPYSLLVHDISFLIEPAWFRRHARYWHAWVNARRQIQQATHLFAVSQTTKQDLIHHLHIPSDRIVVLPIGIDAPASPTDLPDPLQGKRFLLALGKHDPRKNAACIIQAFHELIKDPAYKDVLLVLTGASETSKHPQILHLKRPSDAALSALMQSASCFLYPSWYEGFGLPLHEAAFFHTPCIASVTSCLPETAPIGVQFAPPTKPHLWTAALKEILSNPTHFKTQTQTRSWKEAGKVIVKTIFE